MVRARSETKPEKKLIFRDLHQAVWDALPLDFKDRFSDHSRLHLIVRTIFKTMAKGIKRDGFVTIEGLGRFHLKTLPARKRGHLFCSFYNDEVTSGEFPPQVVVRFKAVKDIRSDIEDNDE